MNVNKLVNFIRNNPNEEESCRILNDILNSYWIRGFEKRSFLELKLKYARDRMKKRKENELEQLYEKVSKEGYYDNNLRKEVLKRYYDDIQITEKDINNANK